MLAWEKRPFEIANLLNPAFCSLVLYAAVKDFTQESRQGMPFALTFLVLPLVLHKQTRESFPQSTRTSLLEWLKEQPEEFGVLFVARTRRFVPYTKESLTFGMQRQIFEIDDSGNVVCGTEKIDFRRMTGSPIIPLIENSRLLGRWFTKSEHETVIFKTLGIRP